MQQTTSGADRHSILNHKIQAFHLQLGRVDFIGDESGNDVLLIQSLCDLRSIIGHHLDESVLVGRRQDLQTFFAIYFFELGEVVRPLDEGSNNDGRKFRFPALHQILAEEFLELF